MNQLFVNPGMQLMVRAITAQHLDFDTMPFIGCDLRTAEPLAHGRRNIVTGYFVSAEVSFDLTETDFIVGIGRGLDTHDVLVIVTCFVAKLLAHVNHGAQIKGVGFRREEPHDLGRCGPTLEVNGF